MGSRDTNWSGADKDWDRLLVAIHRNCICDANPEAPCAACQLLSDRDALKRLDFARRSRKFYVDGEELDAEHDPEQSTG